MPVFALTTCHWNGVTYAPGDEIDTTGYGPHQLRALFSTVPVYGMPDAVEEHTLGTAIAVSMSFGGG